MGCGMQCPGCSLPCLGHRVDRGMPHGQAAGAKRGWGHVGSSRNAWDGEIEALLVTLAVVSASQGQWDPSQGKGGTARGRRRQ